MTARESFADLVRRAVLGNASAREVALLEADATIERYLVELRRVAQSLNDHLSNGRLNSHQRRGASRLYTAYAARIAEISPKVKELNRRRSSDDTRALKIEVSRLRSAIRTHRAHAREAGCDPEPFDVELWGHVTVAASSGARS